MNQIPELNNDCLINIFRYIDITDTESLLNYCLVSQWFLQHVPRHARIKDSRILIPCSLTIVRSIIKNPTLRFDTLKYLNLNAIYVKQGRDKVHKLLAFKDCNVSLNSNSLLANMLTGTCV